MSATHFSYNSLQSHSTFENGMGRTQIMEVKIKNGKGHKKVTLKNSKGKTLSSKGFDLNDDEIGRIMNKEFIPGLFRPCLDHCNGSIRPLRESLRKTRRASRGQRR